MLRTFRDNVLNLPVVSLVRQRICKTIKHIVLSSADFLSFRWTALKYWRLCRRQELKSQYRLCWKTSRYAFRRETSVENKNTPGYLPNLWTVCHNASKSFSLFFFFFSFCNLSQFKHWIFISFYSLRQYFSSFLCSWCYLIVVIFGTLAKTYLTELCLIAFVKIYV